MPACEYPAADASLDVQLNEGVLVVTMNRPEKRNAFHGPMRAALRSVFQTAGRDRAVRVFVITGAGGAFCSGADLTAEDRTPWPTGPAEPLFAWCTELLEMPKPTIAAIDGVAAGGGPGLALLCDIRFCSADARLIPIWLKRAIHPDDLITWTLPRLVGYSRALKWMYLAEDIPLAEATSAGMIEELTKTPVALDTALPMARRLALGLPAHLALTKQAVLRNLQREQFDAALIESWGQDRARASADYKEGIAAFREKRTARFTGG